MNIFNFTSIFFYCVAVIAVSITIVCPDLFFEKTRPNHMKYRLIKNGLDEYHIEKYLANMPEHSINHSYMWINMFIPVKNKEEGIKKINNLIKKDKKTQESIKKIQSFDVIYVATDNE